ncbi:MAG: mechanosensitive ion channel family protein [Actinomycetota bacterium]|nr:mechanosensitive ion channel family protein [Actinomycetota bacterium]
MIFPSADGELDCEQTDDLCRLVYRFTDNEAAAETVQWAVAKPLAIAGLLIGAVAVRWLLHRLINRLVAKAAGGDSPGLLQRTKAHEKLVGANPAAFERRAQRADTMGSLLGSVSTVVIFAVVSFMVVAELGYNIAPLIASAGILGVAIGFGAQSLVSDFLSGVFMIFEDQYGVGDVIDIGDASGSVEAIGLRVTRLRDVNGTVWWVRNGEISRVGNMSQNWSRTVLDIPVAYGEDLGWIRETLGETARELHADAKYEALILEEPEVWGVERWDADAVIVRVVLKTAPLEQWNVARELRERIKDRFDELNIEIPFAQRVVWMRQGQPYENQPGDQRAVPTTDMGDRDMGDGDMGDTAGGQQPATEPADGSEADHDRRRDDDPTRLPTDEPTEDPADDSSTGSSGDSADGEDR